MFFLVCVRVRFFSRCFRFSDGDGSRDIGVSSSYFYVWYSCVLCFIFYFCFVLGGGYCFFL